MADATVRSTAPCGDVIERNGDDLVIRAVFPIADLEVSRFRNPILLFRGERFALTAVEGNTKRPTYRLTVERPNLYEPGGKEIEYDGARHLERRRERRRVALAWLLWLPTVPLMPFIGLLPESVKDKLVALGVNPGRATRLSLTIEWLLLFLLVLAYLFSGGLFTIPGAITGAFALLTAVDICYRVTADADHRNPGAFAVVGEFVRFIRVMTTRDDHLLEEAPENESEISGNDSAGGA